MPSEDLNLHVPDALSLSKTDTQEVWQQTNGQWDKVCVHGAAGGGWENPSLRPRNRAGLVYTEGCEETRLGSAKCPGRK